LEGLGSGPFYIEVSGFNGSTGNYTLDFNLGLLKKQEASLLDFGQG
jgi:hypothetical protein